MQVPSPQLRHRTLRRALVPAALLACAGLLAVGVVQAALPSRGAAFSFHDHVTEGKKWHVEIRVDPGNKRKVKALVVYSELCKATIAKRDVPISDAGVIAAGGELNGGGTWAVNATVMEPTKIVGTMQMKRTDCDTGVLNYPNAITGDGHTNHTHSGGSGSHNHGPQYPDFTKASRKQRWQARALQLRVLRTWRGMTPAKAQRLGFRRPPGAAKLVGRMFHVYNLRYEADGRTFDARRPESLVFWRRSNGASVLLGPMFRVPAGRRPRFAGPIPIYHGHPNRSGRIPNQMTHVWMVKGRKSAWAGCLPVTHLEQYNPKFKWKRTTTRKHVGTPCSEGASGT